MDRLENGRLSRSGPAQDERDTAADRVPDRVPLPGVQCDPLGALVVVQHRLDVGSGPSKDVADGRLVDDCGAGGERARADEAAGEGRGAPLGPSRYLVDELWTCARPMGIRGWAWAELDGVGDSERTAVISSGRCETSSDALPKLIDALASSAHARAALIREGLLVV